MITTLIFDMDGVLMDSSPAHAAAFKKVLEEQGVRDFEYTTVAGMRTDEAFEKVFAKRGEKRAKPEIDRMVAKKRELARQQILGAPSIFPGYPEVIRELGKSYRIGLASSASRPLVETFLSLSPIEIFSTVVAGDDVKNAKPSPDIFLLCATKLGAKPENCVVIEDSLAGIQAALTAKMRVIVMGDSTSVLPQSEKILGRVHLLSEIKGYL